MWESVCLQGCRHNNWQLRRALGVFGCRCSVRRLAASEQEELMLCHASPPRPQFHLPPGARFIVWPRNSARFRHAYGLRFIVSRLPDKLHTQLKRACTPPHQCHTPLSWPPKTHATTNSQSITKVSMPNRPPCSIQVNSCQRIWLQRQTQTCGVAGAPTASTSMPASARKCLCHT